MTPPLDDAGVERVARAVEAVRSIGRAGGIPASDPAAIRAVEEFNYAADVDGVAALLARLRAAEAREAELEAALRKIVWRSEGADPARDESGDLARDLHHVNSAVKDALRAAGGGRADG